MIRLYARDFKAIETNESLALSLSFAFYAMEYHALVTPRDDLIHVMIGSLSGLLAFSIAAVAFIIALPDSKKIGRFRRTGHYSEVINIYVDAVTWISVSIISLILISMANEGFLEAIGFSDSHAIWLTLFTLIITTVKLGRCVWITIKLFSLSQEDR